MNSELQTVLEQARTLPPAALPRLLADLREVEVTALARLTTPLQAPALPADELLSVPQTATHLHCSEVYLYKNARKLPFARRLGKKLLFSRNGIEEYLRKQGR